MQVAASFGPTDNDLSRQQDDAGISRETSMLNAEYGRFHPCRMLPGLGMSLTDRMGLRRVTPRCWRLAAKKPDLRCIHENDRGIAA